jgi:TatD DNase family protein
MRLDTHCHLDAAEFNSDRHEVIMRARTAGVQGILIPAVEAAHFQTVRSLAHAFPEGAYALGIHPMYVNAASLDDLSVLREMLEQNLHDPKLIAVGEIGLDFFVPDISCGEPKEKQIHFFTAQLALAKQFDLPVLLHVRRSQDTILKYLRKAGVSGGIAHAFNGSFQQAQQLIDLGFALGLGGAMTYARAQQIRRLAQTLPLESLVLETDAPDLPPEWLTESRRNEPAQVVKIAQVLADLRQITLDTVFHGTSHAAMRVCPRWRSLLLRV